MVGSPTSFSTSDVQTRKVWAERMLYDSISDENMVGQLVKDGTLIRKDDLSKTGGMGRGDEVKYHFLNRLSSKGLVGMQSATGNEQALTYYQDTVLINQVREVVKNPNKGSIDQQRVTFNLEEDTYQVLKNWFTERMTVSAINQLTGNTATTLAYDGQTYSSDERLVLTGLNAATAPAGTGRIVRPNSLTTDQAVNADTTATMKFSLIDSMIDGARTNRPYITPFDGAIKFKMYVHINTFRQLWQDTTSPFQYRDFVYNKLAGGVNDAQLEGEFIDYNMTRIVATDKMPYGVHSSTAAQQTNTRRSMLVGKNAGAIAFGQGYAGGSTPTAGFSFEQDFEDVNLYKRTAIVGVYGIAKAQFNSIDNGVIVSTTYVA